MPRKACIDALGAFHHIFVSGMERKKFFLTTVIGTNYLTARRRYRE